MKAQPISDSDDDIAPGHVAVGRVLAASGLRGDVKVEPLAPDTEFARGRRVSINGRARVIDSSRRRERFVYVKLSGVEGREEAASLRGAYLQVPEGDLAALPDGQFYRFQLIGLTVRATDGGDIGRITDVISTPENDVFVVQGPLGEVLIPSTSDVVQKVDLADRTVTVEVIPGLLG